MTTFSRTARMTQGYDCDQVDEFFARARVAYELVGRDSGGRSRPALTARDVRVVAFDLVRGGYQVRQVDSALDRLEDAVARREREAVVGRQGEQALLDQLTRRAQTLHSRLTRPDGDRFARAHGVDASYDVGDVDELCTRLLGYFDDGEEMSADEVRRAVFRTRRGSRGYREAEVDAFLDRAVEIMVSVD
ncbi:MAG TPA: DivIVA domain-containing protein [Actinomycetales bacterium]|nr:DivIVA domain-containing protein [Actinomycetales bacterium]